MIEPVTRIWNLRATDLAWGVLRSERQEGVAKLVGL
jgi:hypothetical protein